jgi:hypothetical protein
MSHFSTVQVTYTDLDALQAALAASGYGFTLHQTAQQLRNDWGTATDEHRAELVVTIPGSRAEVGFALRDGAWHLIADDYELMCHADSFKQELALNYATVQAQRLGYQVVREGNELIACPIQ